MASTQVGFEMSIRKTSRAAAANGSNKSDLSSMFFSPCRRAATTGGFRPFLPADTYLPPTTSDGQFGSNYRCRRVPFFITINAWDTEVINISENFFFQLKTQPHLWIKMSYAQCFATIPSAISENTHSCRQVDNITGNCTWIPVFWSYDQHYHHLHRRHH